MNRLEELIRQLCPDGVECRRLGEIVEIRSGWGFPNKEQGKKQGDVPFFKVGDMNTPGNELYMVSSQNYVDNSTVGRLKCKPAPAGTIVFPKIGAAISTNKKRILVCKSCYDNNVMGLISSPCLQSKYLYYLIDSVDLMNFADYSGAMPSIRKSTLEKYSIPVPPMKIQQEIVRILDQFTELTAELNAELTAELTARKKQYEYYLDNLLCKEICKETSVSNIVQLGEVCSFFNGDRGKNYPSQSDYIAFGIPFINAGDLEHGSVLIEKCKKISVQKFHSMGGAKLQKGDILYCLRGSIGKNGIFNGNYGTIASSLVAIRPHPNVCSKYIYYLLNSQLEKKQRICKDNGAAQPNLSAQSVKNYRFPLPPLSEQRRIVSILDRFDALCNDLTSGLPAEIEARKKQYEYYRDKLLTFKKKTP